MWYDYRMNPMISVVIPTFNRASMVCECVKSVLATGYSPLEVVVVDDCSPDDTGSRIAAAFGADGRVRYVRNERNSFQAVSRNRGVMAAHGEYLFFLDDDNVVHPDILVKLMDVFKANRDMGLVAPMAIHRRSGGPPTIWSLGSDFSRWTSQPRDHGANLPLADFEAEHGKRDETFPTTYYPNGFMVPRRTFDAVGGFDESYVQIFEESDFGWRVTEAGYRACVATGARTDHYGFLEPGCVPELRRLGIERPYRTYCFARNRLRFAMRHFSVLQAISVTLVFAPLSAVYYGIVAIRNRRPDIAFAYLRGMLAGMFPCRR